MDDREKVIKVLNDALTAKENYPWAKAEMSFEFIEMLLELLKDQPKIVLCKNCKYWWFESYCEKHGKGQKDPGWFCADGERNDESSD